MKRCLLFIFVSVFISTYVTAENPTAEILKTNSTPVLDGKIDVLWANVEAHSIDRPVVSETLGGDFTLGESGTTYWKALWVPEGIYVLVQVNDNVFFPYYGGANPTKPWNYDKIELFFDVGEVLADGGIWNVPHYQIAPDYVEGKINGELQTTEDGVKYAFKLNGSAYLCEYFIPFSKFPEMNIERSIGFEVIIVDCDAEGVLNYAGWGDVTYTSLDGAGIITLSNTMMDTNPTAEILKTNSTPVLDGDIDVLWGSVEAHSIDRPVVSETLGGDFTLGESGTTYWKALWVPDGIYVLVQVNDNVFFPYYGGANPTKPWNYDKIEIYFDVGEVLADGGIWNAPHYQIAPDYVEGKINGELQTTEDGVKYAFKLNGSAYVCEYYIPFSKFPEMNIERSVGFEVIIVDCDAEGVLNYAGWGEVTYTSLDGAGIINFSNTLVTSSTNLIHSDGFINIYPNPVNTYFNVVLSSAISIDNARMEIYDFTGKEMKNVPVNNYQTVVERAGMKSGMYLYRIINNNNIIGNGKLIVQ